MNPAAVLPNGGCQPGCLVSGRVCLVGVGRDLVRARVPFGILLSGHIDWRSWRIASVPHSRVGLQLL